MADKGRIALAAALLLVVQSFFAAFTLGASAAPLDAFGNPLCAAGVASAAEHGQGHASLPDCCKLGCSAMSGGLATPVGEAAWQAPFLLLPVTGPLKSPDSDRAEPKYRPGLPRAPPAAAA